MAGWRRRAPTRSCLHPARSIVRSTSRRWIMERSFMSEQRTQPTPAVAEPPPLLGRMGHGPRPIGQQIEHAKNKRGTVIRLWGYLRQQKIALSLTAAMVAVTVVLNVLGPYLLGVAIDAYISRGDLRGLAQLCI